MGKPDGGGGLFVSAHGEAESDRQHAGEPGADGGEKGEGDEEALDGRHR
jgi:hypothetical protein